MARRLPHRFLAAALPTAASVAAVSFLSITRAGVAGLPPNVVPLEPVATPSPVPVIDMAALFAEARTAQTDGEYEVAATVDGPSIWPTPAPRYLGLKSGESFWATGDPRCCD
ncbi:MAG: hypothetical protein EXR51_03290 [Dehalococcoidia bacterium]|nr:hypothetical protein [Dehalococcoidia bacterium]